MLPAGSDATSLRGTPKYLLWAYAKGAATLDHLRVTIGDEAFGRALGAYVARCRNVGCGAEDLRAAIEAETGGDLEPFWQRWVTGSSRPPVTIAFEPRDRHVDLTLTKPDDAPMTLELWLQLEDGTTQRARVDLEGSTTTRAIETPSRVRAVAPNPRHVLMVDARSSVPFDLDFDGETDGFDLLRCTRHVGKRYETPHGRGLWTVDESFEPACDLDDNLMIDERDITLLAEHFGVIRGGRP